MLIAHFVRNLMVLVSIASALMLASYAFAADYSSDSFMVRDPAPNDFGGTATSSSFFNVQSGSDIADIEATSTSFTLNSGFLHYENFAAVSQNWRWYDDAENETPSTALADENVAPTNNQNDNEIKLRMTIASLPGVSAEMTKFRLEYATSSAFSNGGTPVVEEGACTLASIWCYADAGGADNVLITTALLSDTDGCVSSVGDGCGTHNESGTSTSSFTHTASTTREYEFTLVQSGATPNTVYFFRAYDNGSSSAIPAYESNSYPSISTSGTTLTFSIDGLASTTATEGVTTDVDTTSTSISFGTLQIGVPVIAAQRLTVSTNATQGYKIFAIQRQGFLSNSAAEIPPVIGTNVSPAAWDSGCVSEIGCYGYHSGEDVLDGGSTRFAANDTYAGFASTPEEIAYNAGPATAKTTDVVYKVEANSLQAAGTYDSTVVFIVTPVF